MAFLFNYVEPYFDFLGSECNLSYAFPSNHNRTALHAACSKGHLMLVHLLLQAGADPNLVDNKMKSPIRMAAKNGHKDVVQYLMTYNGAPEIKVLFRFNLRSNNVYHLFILCCHYLRIFRV